MVLLSAGAAEVVPVSWNARNSGSPCSLCPFACHGSAFHVVELQGQFEILLLANSHHSLEVIDLLARYTDQVVHICGWTLEPANFDAFTNF